MSLLKQNTIKKKRVNENNITELDVSNNDNKYKVKAIYVSVVYTKKSESGYL